MRESRPQNKSIVLISVVVVTTALYLAKDFLMPLAMAILIAFLLAPCVAKLESWGFRRVWAVVTTALVSFCLLAVALFVMAVQLMDLANELPKYKDNLRSKAASMKMRKDGPVSNVATTVREVAREFSPEEAAKQDAAESPDAAAVPVEVVALKSSPLEVIRQIAGPVLAPIGTFAMVMLFVIFILIERQDLRDRFIHLVGRGKLYVTTQALDEAADKVSRYLFAQLTVNVTYGIPVAIGLYFIGIPNAALWGLLTILLRFIPYIGPWMGAFFPTLLSFAITPGWTPLVLTVGLFVTMELISNNVVEPWLYGTSTGLSPIAVIISAVFWTWIWGVGGLLLATPLTVCVAVLGKYVADLAFLDVLLGSRPPIAPEHRYYQRLLAGDEVELFEIVEGYAERGAVPELFDQVVLPALILAEQDRAAGILTREEHEEIYRAVRESLECVEGMVTEPHGKPGCFVIVPARSEADEIAGLMLAHLLEKQGCHGYVVSHRALRGEILEVLEGSSTRCLCVSAVTRVSARVGELLLRRMAGAATYSVLGLWWGGNPSKHAPVEQVQVVRTIQEASHYITERAFLKAAVAEVEEKGTTAGE